MKKVYLGGPTCFKKNAIQQYGYMSSYLLDLGFLALVPIDNECADALEIKLNNELMIEKADILLCDISPFRGPSADVGTIYELALGFAKGKTVVLYSDDNREYKDKAQGLDNMFVENHSLQDNLMITAGRVIWGSFEDAVKYLKGVS